MHDALETTSRSATALSHAFIQFFTLFVGGYVVRIEMNVRNGNQVKNNKSLVTN